MLGGEIGVIDWGCPRCKARILPPLAGWSALLLVVDDAIVGLSQPLTEALNQLASSPRRGSDLIEKVTRRENLDFNVVYGSSGCIPRAILHYAHLADELPCADRAEKDGVTIEFP
jgi:hypothetical protein